MLERILLGGGADGDEYFLATQRDGDNAYFGTTATANQRLSVDATGNISVNASQTDGVSNGPWTLSRFDKNGSVTQFSKTVNNSLNGQTMTRDSAGNYYVAANGNGSFIYLFKFDPSGSLLWQRTVTSSTSNMTVSGIRVDSTDANVFVCGSRLVTSTLYGWVTKITSAGAHSFSRSASTACQFTSMAIDGSNNVYCCGPLSSGGLLVMKFSSTGATSFTRKYSVTGTSTAAGYGHSISCDGSFIYVSGTFGSSYTPHVMKMDLTGVIQWSRYVNVSPLFAQAPISVGHDASGNVYLAAGTSSDTPRELMLFKFDSSGTLQWQRAWSGTSAPNTAVISDIIVRNNNIYYSGMYYGGFMIDGFWIMKVPANGTMTNGTTYKSTSYTVGSPPASITQAATTVSISTTAYTVTTPTFTVSNDNVYLNKAVTL